MSRATFPVGECVLDAERWVTIRADDAVTLERVLHRAAVRAGTRALLARREGRPDLEATAEAEYRECRAWADTLHTALADAATPAEPRAA